MSLTARVAAEHLEELGFMLRLRLGAAESGADDEEADERLEAHLDGLRFSGDDGVEVMTEHLGRFDPDEVFGAAYALASLPDLNGALEAVLDGFAAAQDETVATISLALRHALHPALAARLVPLLVHDRAPVRAAAANVLGYRRAITAQQLWPLLQDPDPHVRHAAFAAMVRVSGPGDWPPLEQAAFARPDGPTDEERVDLVRLGSRTALDHCR